MPLAWFTDLSPVAQAFLATCGTWLLTAAGAGLVLVFRSVSRKLLDGMLGFAAGVMIAASFWSLLAPALRMAAEGPLPAWVPAVAGFLAGGVFLWAVGSILPYFIADSLPQSVVAAFCTLNPFVAAATAVSTEVFVDLPANLWMHNIVLVVAASAVLLVLTVWKVWRAMLPQDG